MRHLYIPSCCAALALAPLLTGCGSSDDKSSDGTGGTSSTTQSVTVEVFSWWTAPGEAEALRSLMDLHATKYPQERIYNAATDPKVISGGIEAKQVLQMRLADGDPPDAFQTNAYELKLGFFAQNPGLLEPLDDLFAEQGLDKDLAPEALSDITIDGHQIAVPVNVHRENGLFFNKTLFDQNGLEPPQTMAEFLDVCDKLKAAGVTPLAISTSQNWIINKVFLAMALGSMGPDKFIKYFVDKDPVMEADFVPTIDLLDHVLTDYIDVKTAAGDGYGWTQAADSLMNGEAAMFIHGDWAKGYLMQLGWTPNVDFGVMATPDSGGAFLYGMDVFALPVGAKHPKEAHDFLTTVSSADGQIGFNELKGSSPVRLGLPTADLDPVAKNIYADFKDATHRIPTVGLPTAWDEGFGQLAKDHDKQALLQTFLDNPIE